MLHDLLFSSHNVEIFSIMPSNGGGLYPVLPSRWGGYEYLYRLFVPKLLEILYYSYFFVRGSSEDTRRVTTPAISEFAVQAGVQFILYVVEQTVPTYCVGSLRSDHVKRGILFRVPTSFLNILRYFQF